MKSKSFMLMILSMGFGLIAAIGISQVMGRSNGDAADAPKMGPVIVAALHLDYSSELTTDNVVLENWPIEIIPEGAATSLDEIENMFIKNPIAKDMPLIRTQIVTKQDLNRLPIPAGYRVVAIKVTAASLVGGLLGPGDKVDVIGFFERKNRGGIKETTTRTFLKGLRVFNVNNKMSAADKREDGSSNASAIVGVLVTQSQAEDLIQVLKKTGSVHLVMRPNSMPDDEEVDSLADILDWENSSNLADQENGNDHAPSNVPSMAVNATNFRQPNSMIVWVGNTPEKIVFSPNALPRRLGPGTIATPVPEEKGAQAEQVDLNGSDEIDRSQEQDQYRGE